MTTKTQRRNKQRSSARAKKNNLTSSSGPSASLARESFRFMPIFPPRVVKTLRYASFGSLTSTSGAVSTYVIRANDLFDPDFTSTGHQPMGFDQMMLFYNHFCVVYAKIWVTFKNQSGSLTPTICVRLDADSTPLTVPDRIIEFGGAQLDVLESKAVTGSVKTLSEQVDIPKVQGVSRKAMTADNAVCGTAAASPAEVSYFHIAIWDNGAATTTVAFDFVLEQTAIFFEPRNLIESLKIPKPSRHLETDDFEDCAPPVLRDPSSERKREVVTKPSRR